MANSNGQRESGGGLLTAHLVGADGVHSASGGLVGRAGDHTGVHIDDQSAGESGRDDEVVEELAVGVRLSHLDVLVDL